VADNRSFIVIPARLASTRLPRKLLLNQTGKTVLQHTYEAACGAALPAGVCIAADHPEIEAAAQAFGATVVMTNPAAASGADRVAEVAAAMHDVDILINVQGDEPEIEPAAIDLVASLLAEHPAAPMATLITPIRSRQLLEDPSCVKVVTGADGRALYFSRSVIPHPREWSDDLLERNPPVFFQHLGLYAYRREYLLKLSQLPPSPLEELEKLEQLRVLSAGGAIVTGVVEHAAPGIDTAADYTAFVSRMNQR